MSSPQEFKPPTLPQLKKLFHLLGTNYEELSEAQKDTAKKILTKAIYYEPKRLSGRILSEFVMIYAYEMYGKGKVAKGNASPLQLEKGNLAENDAISILSLIDGVKYEKNEKVFENKWFKGIPDIIVRKTDGLVEKVIDIKVSYDLPSFIMAKLRAESTANVYELFGYMDLLKCKQGEIVHILVDMPDSIVSMEEQRLRERYSHLELDEETVSSRLQLVFNNMEYSNVPEGLKHFRRSFIYNPNTMKTVKFRANFAKKFMKKIHESFINNDVFLQEPDAETEEDNV